MHNEASGFVDDDKVIIFKNDRQANILRFRLVRTRGRDGEFKALSRKFLRGGVIGRFSGNKHGIFGNQALDTGTRKLGQGMRQCTVEATFA